MSEEKKLILKMLKEGKISEDEALKLLDVINNNSREEKKSYENNKSFENSVDSFVSKILSGIDNALKKAEDKINDSEFQFGNLYFEYSNFKGKLNKELEIRDIKDKINLYINNTDGKIEINSWNEDYIQCNSKIFYDDTFFKGNEDFIISKIDSNNYYLGINKELDTKKYSSKLLINIPSNQIDSITCKNINGKIEIYDVITKYINAEGTNSKIVLKDLTIENSEINTNNGKIEIKNMHSNNIDIKTSNGKIDVKNIDTKFLNIKNSNGSININGISNKANSLIINSSNGSINLENIDYNKPVIAKLNGRSIEEINPIFSNILVKENTIIAKTNDYNDNVEDYLEIIASTSNGKVSIL